MADSAQIPINGTYHAQPSYHESFNHTHTAVNSVSNFQPAQSSTPSNAPSNEQKNGIARDEVGWYFVEQYYTNMSRSPDKLHLFYSRRSQLVFGTEAETVTVTVGQKAIQEKIKQLDFQDCKVRVLNVDSQASFDNILVSVIGEISNKQEPSRKFVQTFVLAEQPNGYYVLNDVFRYLVDDEITEDAAVEAPAEEPEAEHPEAIPEAAAVEASAEEPEAKVDEKLEEVATKVEEEPAPRTNGAEHPEATLEASPEAVPEAAPEAAPAATESAAANVEAEVPKPEEPASRKPTPVPTAQKEVQPEAAPPAKAAIPKTWANIASKIGAAAPVVPAIPAVPVKPAPTPAAQKEVQPVAPAPAAAPAPAPVAESVPSQPSSNDGSGWQTAGHDHKKSQARSSAEDQNVLGYIKNVTDKVDANLLKQTLSRFGKLKHFDVSRQKNCAFVEFSDASAYNAAVAANPHQIGTEQVNVEERRTRGSAYGGIPGRGGGASRGRGDRAGSQGRGGFPRDGRGSFPPRGRGGNVNPKGRNQAQAA